MYDDCGWNGEIVDLDVTGDPQLDQLGYRSPRRDFRRKPTFPRDWQAQAQRDRAERQGRRLAAVEANRADTRRRNAERRGKPVSSPADTRATEEIALSPQHGATEEITLPTQPQYGAYFEVRTVRRWWAPWTTRKVWQQVGPWVVGEPPKGADVVTVPSVEALPGRVTTIGTVGETGAVLY